MKIVNGITSNPKQSLILTLDDGSQVSLSLEYDAQQSGWFASPSFGDWSVNGLRLTAFPNVLRQWREIVPFGLAVLTSGNIEPTAITDFIDGTATMYLLNADDVTSVETTTFGGY